MDVVTAEEFRQSGFQVPLADVRHVDAHHLAGIYRRAISELVVSDRKTRAYTILAEICDFHFRPSSPAEPFGARIVLEDRRSAIPADFEGQQLAELAVLVKESANPGLRARLADVAWVVRKSEFGMAELAIEAYCTAALGLLSGAFEPAFPSAGAAGGEALQLIERSLRIATRVRKAGVGDPRPASALDDLRRSARDAGDVPLYTRMARVALLSGALGIQDVAAEAAAIADAAATTADPWVVKELFETTAGLFNRLGDKPARDRHRIAAAEQMVRLADLAAGSAMSSASFLMDAIGELRPLPNTKARRAELEERLNNIQADSLDEMGVITSGEIDLSQTAEQVTKLFSEDDLPSCLRSLAMLARSPSEAELREEALESAKAAPLQAMLGAKVLDEQGRVIADVPGLAPAGDPAPDWLHFQYARTESFRRGAFVAGVFEPARRAIVDRFNVGEDAFRWIVAHSPFVPVEHERIFAAGFAHLIHGDTLQAAYLLLPQMENSIRRIVRAVGSDPTVVKANLIQEDANLSTLLTKFRGELEAVFGPELMLEVELLFDSRFGPALRHLSAHGKLSEPAALSHDSVYACWLTYRVTCLPLLSTWGTSGREPDRPISGVDEAR